MDIVKDSLVKAAAVTLLILAVGVLTGLQADDVRKSYVETQLTESSLKTQSLVVTQNYLEESSKNYCNVVNSKIPRLSEENTEIGSTLQSFTGKSISNQDEYKRLRREYYINQLRLYNMLTKYKSRCENDTTLIFFFFDESTDSKRQGTALTKYYKEVNNETSILTYNLDADESEVVNILKSDYGIEKGPSIVVNGNYTYRKYIPFQQLPRAINGTLEKSHNITQN